MGGNATKHFGTSRVNHEEYTHIVSFIEQLTHDLNAHITRSWKKESYGDVDVVFSCANDREKFVERLQHNYLVSPREIVKNGKCISLAMNYKNTKVQVDCIHNAVHSFVNWFDYGDMAMLIGRIIPYQLKFAMDGLYLRNNKLGDDVLITHDFHEALEFLGFNVNWFIGGFDSQNEMLNWIGFSKYFNNFGLVNNDRSTQKMRRDVVRESLKFEIDYLLQMFENKKFDKEKLQPFKVELNKKVKLAKQKRQFKKRYKKVIDNLLLPPNSAVCLDDLKLSDYDNMSLKQITEALHPNYNEFNSVHDVHYMYTKHANPTHDLFVTHYFQNNDCTAFKRCVAMLFDLVYNKIVHIKDILKWDLNTHIIKMLCIMHKIDDVFNVDQKFLKYDTVKYIVNMQQKLQVELYDKPDITHK